MRCNAIDDALLAEYLLGGLSPARAKEIETHLSECARCASESDRVRTLLADLREVGGRLGAPDRPERASEVMAALENTPAPRRPAHGIAAARRGRPVWPWAAAAGVLAIITLWATVGPSKPAPIPAPGAKIRSAEPVREVAQGVAEPTPPRERNVDPLPPPPEPPRVEAETKPPPIQNEPPPAAVPQPPPKPPVETGKPVLPDLPPRETLAFAATLEYVRGDVFRVASGAATRAKEGDGLVSGQDLETRGAESAARVRYPDGTSLELWPDTTVRDLHDLEPKGVRGKRVGVARGTLIANVVRQPAGKLMVLATPHAESTVLGTSFRLAVDAASTRLEVKEGRVRFARPAGKSSAEVRSGQYAVATADADPAAKPLSTAEIVLLPQQGHVSGKVWQLVKDAEAVAEFAFEAVRAPSRDEQMAQGLPRAPRVTFSFQADPDITYFVWMRGRGTPGTPPQDAVFVEVPGGHFIGQPQMDKDRLGGSAERALFEGFGQRPGYAWIGGDEQDGRHELPVRLRVTRPGVQTLTLHADEGPIRIDAIWISATQSARPEESQKGPWTHRK